MFPSLLFDVAYHCEYMLSMYRYSFGENGDWSIVAVTSLWLSRYVVVRIMCTSDGSTTTKLTPTTSNNNNVMMPTTNPSSSSLAATTNTTPATTTTTTTAYQILNKYWNSIPPFQLVMAASVFFLCVTTIFNLHANSSSLTGNPNTNSHSYYSYYMNSNTYGAARI